MKSIAFFQFSTEEDLSFVLEFSGLDLSARDFEIKVTERSSNTTKVTLTNGSGITVTGSNVLEAAYAKADMTGWARGEYSADVVDVTGGGHSRIMAVRFVYDLPGRLVQGVQDRKAYINWSPNQAVVTATGAIGPAGPKGDQGDQGDQGATGATGPSGTLAIGVVTTGAPGSDVIITNVGTSTAAVLDITIPRGDVGVTGDKGWSPILAVVADGERRVLQIDDWTGGEGTKPATGSYIGPTGLVAAIGDAVDIRGAQGPSGSVTDGDKGDIVVSSAGTVWTVDAAVLAPYLERDGTSTVTADIPLAGFKLTEVGDATAATDALNRQTGDARYPSIATGLGLNNRLINGAMRVSQRGTVFNATGYTLDRWQIAFGTGGAGTVTQNPITADDLAYSLLWAQTTGGTSPYLAQPVEDARSLGGKRVCISFSAALISGATTLTPVLTQYFGSGGSPSASVVTTGTAITLTGGRVFQFLTLPSIVGKTFGSNGDSYLLLQLVAASGAVFSVSLSDIQLEEAPAPMAQPTPFERVPLALDLALCYRYYQRVPSQRIVPYGAASPAVMETSFPLLATMRATPTATVTTTPTVVAATSLSLSPTRYSYCVSLTKTDDAGQYAMSADGVFSFSAEL